MAIARALANNPPILIGDEVTGDLDSESGVAIMQLLTILNEEGMTIVFVTHDPRMAEFARRLIHIYDGKLMNDDGTKPQDVTRDIPDSSTLNSYPSNSR